MAHKTDFKDALFEQRKYRMQNNPDGTVTPFDETEYTQVGDRVGAKEFNEIGAALNSLEGKMGERNLQTYTALSQLSLEAPVTMAQVFEAMPNNSYAVIDANGSNTITDVPVSGSGIVEISKINGGRNFARFTKSLSSQTVGMTMWYGTFSWADTTVFSGWKRLLEEDDVLETMEEIEANTDAGKAAGALAVKELSSELRGHIVWTNPNPASNFAAQSVTLLESLNNYSYAEIVYKGVNNAASIKTTGKLPIIEGLAPYLEYTSDYAYRRQITEFFGTTITFADAMYFSNPSTSHVTNNLCIPYRVILYAL